MTPPESHVAADHIVKLDCDDLLPGMYICELDRAWSDTPFQIDGFHLKTAEDIQLVLKFCQFVYIDTNRGAKPQKMKRDQLTILSSARKATPVSAAVKVERDTYPITHSIKPQLDKARKSYHSIKLELDAQASAIRARAGKARNALGGEAESQNLNIALLDQQLLRLIDTIVANPQALIWILNTESVASIAKQPANYCVRAAIWAGILARQLGMSKSDMKVLFQGTLLADIGMNLLPQRLVSKRGPFRRKEFLAYVKHVEFGLEILSGQAALDNRVAGIVRCHHERHDGLGCKTKLMTRDLRNKQHSHSLVQRSPVHVDRRPERQNERADPIADAGAFLDAGDGQGQRAVAAGGAERRQKGWRHSLEELARRAPAQQNQNQRQRNEGMDAQADGHR